MDQAHSPLPRPTSVYLDKMLGHHHPVLDHGFVRVIDYMGTEASIVQAARVSYSAGTKSVRDDRGLIRYLLRHRHTTPFEMCELKLHVKLPIFVARQWIRHRTASVNEVSARYSILANEFYVPEVADMQPQSKTNAQGRGGVLPGATVAAMQETLRQHGHICHRVYQELLHGWPWMDENGLEYISVDADMIEPHEAEVGLARELSRMALSLQSYTEFYWKIDLHNLLHFLSLRMDPHAQKEIRVYADLIGKIVYNWQPLTWEAFEDYVLNAHTFSDAEMVMLRELAHRNPGAVRALSDDANISSRERVAFLNALGLSDA